MMKIPFYKPSIGQPEIDEVVDTLKNGWLTTGPKTKQFEKEFSAYLRQAHSIAVNSCTAALHLALEAIGLKSGDGVIVPTMTFAATAEVVRYLGGRPILVDCREDDLNIDIADAEQKIRAALESGQSVVAIMPVHYGGQVADVAGVKALAQRYGLKVIEDAAHCCPAYYRPQAEPGQRKTNGSSHAPTPGNDWLPVGAEADITCYSFYANKTITTGEGGMACTNSDQYAERMRIMSLHGISKDAWKRFTADGSWYYEIIAPGFKYNLTDIASSLGLHQLRKADELHRRRAQAARFYSEHLAAVDELILPTQKADRIHSWHLYQIRLQTSALSLDRAQFIKELQGRGIGTSVHWMPLHMHPYYRQTYGYVPEQLPVAAAIYPQLVTLPLYPDMTEAELLYVAQNVKDVIAQHRRAPAHRGLAQPVQPQASLTASV